MKSDAAEPAGGSSTGIVSLAQEVYREQQQARHSADNLAQEAALAVAAYAQAPPAGAAGQQPELAVHATMVQALDPAADLVASEYGIQRPAEGERKRKKPLVTEVTVTEKTCIRCQLTKPAADFFHDKYCSDGLKGRCKACQVKCLNEKRALKGELEASGGDTVPEKRCTRCHQVKPADDFYKDNNCSDGLKGRCKQCQAEVNRQRQEASAATEKRCTRCQQVKPVEEFNKDNNCSDGLKGRCKGCQSEAKSARRKRQRQEQAEAEAEAEAEEAPQTAEEAVALSMLNWTAAADPQAAAQISHKTIAPMVHQGIIDAVSAAVMERGAYRR